MSWLGNCTRCGRPTLSTKDDRYWPSETTSAPQSAALWQHDHLSSYGPDGKWLGVHHRDCGSLTPPEIPGSENWLWQKHEFIWGRGCGQEDCSESCYEFGSHLSYAEEGRAAGFGYCPDFDDPVYQSWLISVFSQAQPPVRAPLPASASPIEKRFWDAHRRMALTELDDLVPQHPVLRYRLDFALPGQKVGIELDGFRNHSKTEDIARDCLRQRTIEAEGWRIIRFGGREVHRDAEYCVRETARRVRQLNGASHD